VRPQHLLRVLLCVGACGSPHATPDGSAIADGAVVDGARTADGSQDGSPDAAPEPDAFYADAVLNSCPDTIELVADVTPYLVRDIETDGDRIITVEGRADKPTAVGRVVSRDLFAMDGTTIRSGPREYVIGRTGDRIYGGDRGPGVIWRWRFGEPVEELVTGTGLMSTVAANSTDVYWREVSGIVSRAIAGSGPGSSFSTIEAMFLRADDTVVYASVFSGGRLWQIPTSGGPASVVWSPGPGIMVSGLVVTPETLYWSDFERSVWRRDLATSTNTITAQSTLNLSRPMDIAIHGNYLYVMDWVGANGAGIYRAPRSASSAVLVMQAAAPSGVGPIFVGPYMHWASEGRIYRCTP
jgi:hypothetical protein